MNTERAGPFGLKSWQWKLLALLIVLGIYYVMDAGIRATDAWNDPAVGIDDGFDDLTTQLFDDHVLALEVLGVLLTAAMIGAMVIARPLGGRPDSDHYLTKRKDLKDIQSVSEVDRNLADGSFAATYMTLDPPEEPLPADSEEEE